MEIVSVVLICLGVASPALFLLIVLFVFTASGVTDKASERVDAVINKCGCDGHTS